MSDAAPDPIAAAQAEARARTRGAEGRPRRRRPADGVVAAGEPVVYAGLVTRAVAFVIDAAVVNVVSLVVSAAAALALSILSDGPVAFEDALLVAASLLYVGWSGLYFVVCWATSGQTIGNRVMRIQVVDRRAARTATVGQALIRLIVLTLGIVPLLAGFVILLWDPRRRALHDRLARTVVIDAPPPTA